MARRLRVPLRWLKAEADAGRIPHVRAEKAYLFDPDSVERVLLDRARAPEQQAMNGHGEPESIGEILPRALADFGCQRRIPSPLEEALLDADVRELAPIMEDDE